MTDSRPPILRIALLCIMLAILAGCSSTGRHRGGGYYKDDGPGDRVPANIEAIPDAVPRLETRSPANLRPYSVFGRRYVPLSADRPYRVEGTASWYGRKFHGQKTANGETYDMYAMTAAHPTLPIPSYARVTRASTGKSVIVRINDRGPFHSSRVIDLSYVAAAKLGLIGPGSGQVIVEAITDTDIRGQLYAGNAPKPAPAQPAPAPSLAQSAAPRPRQTLAGAGSSATPNALDALAHDDLATLMNADRPDSNDAPAPAAAAAPRPRDLDAKSVAATSTGPAEAKVVGADPGRIYLQFGAFSAEPSASRLAAKLNGQIAQVESRSAHVEAGGQWYRVQIGPYTSRVEAVNAAVRIQEQTGMQPTMAVR